MLTEYTQLLRPGMSASEEVTGSGGISALFLVGIGGIVLGVLSLIGIAPEMLTAVAVIAFGGGLLLSSNSVWQLYRAKRTWFMGDGAQTTSPAQFLAGEMAAGSAVLQSLSGLAAVVLGILAVTGANSHVLTLVALLVLGATVLMTGGTLSGTVMGFMEPTSRSTSSAG